MEDAKRGQIPNGTISVGMSAALTLPQGQGGGVFPSLAAIFYRTPSSLQTRTVCAVCSLDVLSVTVSSHVSSAVSRYLFNVITNSTLIKKKGPFILKRNMLFKNEN